MVVVEGGTPHWGEPWGTISGCVGGILVTAGGPCLR